MIQWIPMAECNVEKTIRIISGKWTTSILYQLMLGKKRFGELQKTMDGISSKTLTDRLRMLEGKKLISKKVYPEVPLHVEYYLTEKGEKLNKIFNAMDEWGREV
ncbi:helix-turn-helix transcriptional regulator [Candidatus Roizmanbacteria bacterium]|nr:MAG: helix-turn-helix transcriptional regulator [Candidatus Roizmanbacteria bacterium]